MTFSFDGVEAIRAHLDPVLAVIGWRVSFARFDWMTYPSAVGQSTGWTVIVNLRSRPRDGDSR
jgi:hypothetical protein